MNTMFTFKAGTARETLEHIHSYLKQDFLTNSECSLIDSSGSLAGSKIYGQHHTKLPEDFDVFRKECNRTKWDVCLCVAGTDLSDKRRVVLSYYREVNAVAVNFASATNGMTENEKKIYGWLQESFGR